MRTKYLIFGSAMVVFTVSLAGLAAEDKEKPEAPKEESVVAYESKTRGALQVRTVNAKSNEWFVVEKDGKRAFSGAPPLLNSSIELAPGDYVVSVNRTEHKITIDAGKKTVLWTGEVMVEGKKGSGDFYAPFQGKAKKLAAVEPLVNTPTALFAGKYTVTVFMGVKSKDLGDVEVKPGERTVLKE